MTAMAQAVMRSATRYHIVGALHDLRLAIMHERDTRKRARLRRIRDALERLR